MSTHHLNAPDLLDSLRQKNKIKRRKFYISSRLTKLRVEIVALRQAGASYREISLWLRQQKRIKTTHTTVMRYLAKLPECKETPHAELS